MVCDLYNILLMTIYGDSNTVVGQGWRVNVVITESQRNFPCNHLYMGLNGTGASVYFHVIFLVSILYYSYERCPIGKS